jgi:hypothetical protein
MEKTTVRLQTIWFYSETTVDISPEEIRFKDFKKLFPEGNQFCYYFEYYDELFG